MPKTPKHTESKKTVSVLVRPQPEEEPKSLKLWNLAGRLGSGTYGEVQLWRNEFESIAIKKLKTVSDEIQNKKVMEEFNNEKLTLEFLKHPNIIELKKLPAEIKFSTPAYGMQYSNLGSTNQFMWANNFVSGMINHHARRAIKDIAAGLAYMHSKNYTHRDIKPENILVFELSKGEVMFKLIDFGHAKLFSNKAMVCTDKVGTRSYIAPEVYVGNREYYMTIDYWSLGCTIHYIISGHLPYPPPRNESEKIKWASIVKEKSYEAICFHGRYTHDLPVTFFDKIMLPTDLSPEMVKNLAKWFQIAFDVDPSKRGKDRTSGELVIFSNLIDLVPDESLLLVSFYSNESYRYDLNKQTTLWDLKTFVKAHLYIEMSSQCIINSEGTNLEDIILYEENLYMKIEEPILFVFNSQKLIAYTCTFLYMPAMLKYYSKFPHNLNYNQHEKKTCYTTAIFWMSDRLKFFKNFGRGLNLYSCQARKKLKLFKMKFNEFEDNIEKELEKEIEKEMKKQQVYAVILKIKNEIQDLEKKIDLCETFEVDNEFQLRIQNRVVHLLSEFKAITKLSETSEDPLGLSKLMNILSNFQKEYFDFFKDPNLFGILHTIRSIIVLLDTFECKNYFDNFHIKQAEEWPMSVNEILDEYYRDINFMKRVHNQAMNL